METVKRYDDDYSIRAALSENGLLIDFEIVGEDDVVEIYGSVKWDGCMNWATSEDCMFHFCSPADAERLAGMFADVWDEGKKLMPNADKGYGT